MDEAKLFNLYKEIANELGHAIPPRSTILDFGCGNGEMVYVLRELGFDAFGVDIKLDKRNELLRLIPANGPYRIPFKEDSFDIILSNQVLEHVTNLYEALAEMYRVLRPNGLALHCFPPKFKLIEAHTFVPFGGVLQTYPWLLIWSWLGIRNAFQKDLSYKEVAARNFEYLKNNTAYLSKRQIKESIVNRFQNVRFAERYHIKHSDGRAHVIYPLVKVLPAVASFYSSLHMRFVCFEKNPTRDSAVQTN